jgi:hypothetical protein
LAVKCGRTIAERKDLRLVGFLRLRGAM